MMEGSGQGEGYFWLREPTDSPRLDLHIWPTDNLVLLKNPLYLQEANSKGLH